ncbi:BlaI/MecI/CopY family transcriptional regulator [Tessaracoccus lacteus]|uniref:BlaI/MecI/CopY family transcriptional regulator n=1 Tax=Tessaracoccus lacteus TaxID=3041766 RepID=A0ABY8PYC4_9ACTN|nr:BlaI/MecI/CopY family transcriptional regulator [Tessaracoccus sp. T21]WGT47505.1 BlaI/MecI/CopY family transcriptional regulator [Tessaracoccus sp. T21]
MSSRGELEQRIMEVLWSSDAPRSVADVHAILTVERPLAYTTVMTVLDRLAKKGLVTRELVARAWRYEAGYSQSDLLAAELATALQSVSGSVRREALTRLAKLLSDEDLTALRN